MPSDRKILADVAKYRTELIDTCLEQDDAAMEAYLNDGVVPSAEVLRAALRKGTVELRVQSGALRFVVQEQGRAASARRRRRLSARANRRCRSIKTVDADGNPNGERKCSDDEPFSALAFKVINDAYGALTFVRVYSGVLAKGASVQNTTRGKREKIGRMVEMFAKEANPIEEARAGDIIALVSLAETETGDTLCDSDNPVDPRTHALPRSRHQRVRASQEQRPIRRSSTRPSARWFAPIPRCIWKPIAKRARPFCAAWASCTSK